MELLIIRHGDAVDAQPPRIHDESRYLTPKGREVCRLVADELKDHPIERFYTSPLVRAVQTTELLAAAQGPHVEVEVQPILASGDLEGLVRWVQRVDHLDRVAIVGHEPLLGYLLGHLVGSDAVPMRKSGVAMVRRGKDGVHTFGWLRIPGREPITDLAGV